MKRKIVQNVFTNLIPPGFWFGWNYLRKILIQVSLFFHQTGNWSHIKVRFCTKNWEVYWDLFLILKQKFYRYLFSFVYLPFQSYMQWLLKKKSYFEHKEYINFLKNQANARRSAFAPEVLFVFYVFFSELVCTTCLVLYVDFCLSIHYFVLII